MKKIVIQKITLKNSYFFYTKNPKVKLLFKKNTETFKEIDNLKKKKIIDELNRFFDLFVDFRIVTIFFSNSQNKNICFYKSNSFLNKNTKIVFVNFIKYYFFRIEKAYINVELSNIYKTHKNGINFSIPILKEIVRKVLISKTEAELQPHTKKYRKKINEFVMKYKNIKIKSNGPFGERKIKLVYKPDK
ncbi:hypothetical protein SLITO_v1c11180 [Spiroplasma litorale]|uniref:Uncharacterized protein n=1 Tax=Spiroplasma litorale TaxID=216942 RepID=A0A0K1W334_9MOLU|nr:hypothetical protein [Spiroplasma litorale]AKX34729.1 hypothetical protein SLITO_v1c11180 [Spiroplasma litorale]